jgi:DinB superfamily
MMTGTPPPSPPPPPVVPVPDVSTARASATEARDRLEMTIARASSFSEDQLQQRVRDEWSTVESFRHIVLLIDLWLLRAIRGEQDPFHPMALPPTFMPPKLFPDSSIDPDARPSFADACVVLRGRITAVDEYVDTLTPDELARPIDAHAGTVAGALSIIFNELTAHDQFINRDLDLLGAPGD